MKICGQFVIICVFYLTLIRTNYPLIVKKPCELIRERNWKNLWSIRDHLRFILNINSHEKFVANL